MAIDILGHIAKEAKLTIKIGNDMIKDVAEFFHYETEVMGEKGNLVTNPVTIEEFANQKVIEQIKSWVNEARKQRAEKAMSYERLEL